MNAPTPSQTHASFIAPVLSVDAQRNVLSLPGIQLSYPGSLNLNKGAVVHVQARFYQESWQALSVIPVANGWQEEASEPQTPAVNAGAPQQASAAAQTGNEPTTSEPTPTEPSAPAGAPAPRATNRFFTRSSPTSPAPASQTAAAKPAAPAPQATTFEAASPASGVKKPSFADVLKAKRQTAAPNPALSASCPAPTSTPRLAQPEGSKAQAPVAASAPWLPTKKRGAFSSGGQPPEDAAPDFALTPVTQTHRSQTPANRSMSDKDRQRMLKSWGLSEADAGMDIPF